MFLKKSRVAIPFAFLVPGKVTYRLTFKSAGKTTTVATGSKSRTQPGAAKVSLKLGKKGKSLLKKSKKQIRLTLSGSFKPASGGEALPTKTKVTLKRKGS